MFNSKDYFPGKQIAHGGELTNVTAAATLTPDQTFIRASTVSGTGAFAITLPPVAECAGRIFSIQMIVRNSTDDITVQDGNESEDWTDITLNLAADGCLLYSDGRKFWVLADNYT